MSAERLIPCCRPSANVALHTASAHYDGQRNRIERYTTARGTLFEKHITPAGVAAWFQVVKDTNAAPAGG